MDLLNNRYRRLMALKLHDCKSASEYVGKFKVHNDIVNMHELLGLNETFLIFLFHTGLGKEHDEYFTTFRTMRLLIQREKPPSYWSMRCNGLSKPSLTPRPIAPNPRWMSRGHCSTDPIPRASLRSPVIRTSAVDIDE